jgi:hypothetical protein
MGVHKRTENLIRNEVSRFATYKKMLLMGRREAETEGP